jgi:hypothetical protein
MGRSLYAVGGAVLTGGLALLGYQYLFGDYRTLKDIQPDDVAPGAMPTPGKTGWKRVDALLPKLRAISASTGIPLGLLIAWIAKESGGNIASHTSLDERGLLQLMPAESKKLGLDHERLSTDLDYSLDAGVKLIQQYYADALALGVAAAPAGSSFAWMLTKLIHTVGGGQTRKWVKAAQAAGAMGSWGDFETFVLGQRWTGPQPKKWMPFMDSIYKLGRPFGFGSESAPLVAGLGGQCTYCTDGYCEYCDGADGSGPCDCKCRRRPGRTVSPSSMAGLDFLGAA